MAAISTDVKCEGLRTTAVTLARTPSCGMNDTSIRRACGRCAMAELSRGEATA